jgi:hypothetical protein
MNEKKIYLICAIAVAVAMVCFFVMQAANIAYTICLEHVSADGSIYTSSQMEDARDTLLAMHGHKE